MYVCIYIHVYTYAYIHICSSSVQVVLAAVSRDPRQLEHAPLEFRNDRTVVLAAVEKEACRFKKSITHTYTA